MTFRDFCLNKLIDNGMFAEDAAAVMQAAEKHPSNEAMLGRWDDDMEGYPPQMATVCWISVSACALEYIDENMPMAWYRAMFV